MHLMKNGNPCGLPDSHSGQHLSPEAKKRHDDDKRARYRGYDARRRQAVSDHYGLECAYVCFGNCSGPIEIDHKDPDFCGMERPRNSHGSGLHQWLVMNNFPEGFQSVCRYHNVHKGWLTDHEFRLIMTARETGNILRLGNTEGTHSNEWDAVETTRILCA